MDSLPSEPPGKPKNTEVSNLSLLQWIFPTQESNQCLLYWWILYQLSYQGSLCDPIDCSLPDSSVHGTLQARILEWVAMSSSRGSSRPRDRTHTSYVSCIGRQVLYHSKCTGSGVRLIGLNSNIEPLVGGVLDKLLGILAADTTRQNPLVIKGVTSRADLQCVLAQLP